MSIQRTFRDVAKPKVQLVTGALSGGVLPLNEGTHFIFAGSAVTSGVDITSLSGHEYLIDGQQLLLANAHETESLSISIGSFVKEIPAGYSCIVVFDEANVSFYQHLKHADSKPLEDDIAQLQTDLAQEAIDRANEDATFVKLDGSRAMTGSLAMGSNSVTGLAAGASADHAINKGQLDTAVASLESQISANASALKWREPVFAVSKWTGIVAVPSNGDALADSVFGGGNSRLFEDDDAPEQFTVATFPVNEKVLFLEDGQEPKLMVCRDVLGTKRWYDESETDANLKLPRQVEAQDTFVVKNDLLDSPDSHENQAMYHIEAGTPKTAIKIGDIDWDSATGISIDGTYSKGAGGETVVQGDSVQQALQKLDGNIDANDAAQSAALSAAIAQEVIDRDAAIAAESAILSAEIDSDVAAAMSAHEAQTASTANGEGASLVGVEDAGAVYVATTVEGALQEVKLLADQNETDITALQSDVAANQAAISSNDTDIAQNAADIAQLESDLASNSAGFGASKVGIEDANGDFTATTVEGALAELDAKIDNLNLVEQQRGLYEAQASGVSSINLATDLVDVLGGGGVAQDLSSASYMSAVVVRDGAVLIGGVGYTLSAGVLTFTANGGGDLIAGEVVEVKVLNIS